MRVLMLCDRTMQHAGQEILLRRGNAYDLDPSIARAFIATGAAEAVEPRRAPETKPAHVPEVAHGRRGRS